MKRELTHKQKIKKQIDHIFLFTTLAAAIMGGIEGAPFEWEGTKYVHWAIGVLISCFDAFKAYKIRSLADQLPDRPM